MHNILSITNDFIGMMGPVRWIMQSLKYFLDDLCDEPDSDENVPLVPM